MQQRRTVSINPTQQNPGYRRVGVTLTSITATLLVRIMYQCYTTHVCMHDGRALVFPSLVSLLTVCTS